MIGPYFTTQKQKDEHEAKMREVYKNMPTPELPKASVATAPPVRKKKRYNPPSGFRLGDAMPEELKAIGLQYRKRRNRGKISKSNNKGDQRYGKRPSETRRSKY